MTQRDWTRVDRYLEGFFVRPDPVLDHALATARAARLPSIQVSPLQGKLLHLLAKVQGARRILEIGTLGGYSTIWLARALPPGGRLVSLELNERHARVARANLRRAGLGSVVEVRVGPALTSLEDLAAERAAPFDFVFVDADKPNNPAYLVWAVRLSRPGTLIVVDNVVRQGEVARARSADPRVQGTRAMNRSISGDPRLVATTIQIVGRKGYDGLALARVEAAKKGRPVRGRARKVGKPARPSSQ